MRDWLMVLTPIVSAIYFAMHPAQVVELMNWLNNIVR
jgi:hypothetical protein